MKFNPFLWEKNICPDLIIWDWHGQWEEQQCRISAMCPALSSKTWTQSMVTSWKRIWLSAYAYFMYRLCCCNPSTSMGQSLAYSCVRLLQHVARHRRVAKILWDCLWDLRLGPAQCSSACAEWSHLNCERWGHATTHSKINIESEVNDLQ